MQNKFKPFWIEEHTRTFEKLEECEPKSGAFFQAVEYATLESANAEFEKYKVDMAALYRDETGKCYNTISDLRHENKKLADEIERLKLYEINGFEIMNNELKSENARLRAALEVYREFKIGIPHHNGAIIYLADSVLSGEGKEG